MRVKDSNCRLNLQPSGWSESVGEATIVIVRFLSFRSSNAITPRQEICGPSTEPVDNDSKSPLKLSRNRSKGLPVRTMISKFGHDLIE